MSELKVSVSGIRGIWGDSLTLESLKDYTKAFGYYILQNKGKTVLIGRDARPTGALITQYVSSIMNGMGINVIDCGIVPTPTVLFGVRTMNLDGGIIITASHNPVEWNALKFVRKDGTFTGEKDVETIKAYLKKDMQEAAYSEVGSYKKDESVSQMHNQKVLDFVNKNLIQKKKFKVVLDPVNSAGSIISQNLLSELGCETKVINGEITGKFDRGTEPTPANLKHLGPIVKNFKADIGFAQDPDADRLVVIDDEGNVLSEEMTLALVIDHVLSTTKGNIVVNLSTSYIHDYLAEKHGVKCFRSKVGEANVVEGIIEHKALIGGEGNGGVIYPSINTARDSLAGIGLILEMLAVRNRKLSDIVKEYPPLIMVKEKYEFSGNLDQLYNDIKKIFPGASESTLDGLRLDWKEEGHPVWLHIRPSNTEPVIRVIGESDDLKRIQSAITKINPILRK